MPSLMLRLIRSPKRRISRSGQHGRIERRVEALYDAALRLLSRHDYESVSVAAIAREAGCSVGAFYGRFPDKTAFLQSVISVAFRTLTDQATHDLDPARWGGIPKRRVVAGLVRHIVLNMSRDQVAGATRAALKLATIKPAALEPLLEYRATVADHVVALFAPRPSPGGGATAVRTAVQLVFAATIDALRQKAGPLRLGSRQMIDTLGDLIALYLNRPHRAVAEKSEDAAQSPSTVPTPPEPKPGKSLLRPDVDEAAPRPALSRHRGRQAEDPDNAAIRPAEVDPRKVKVPRENAGRSRRRKIHVL
ncbi:MAG TPA: TetR/AcrR family transcriptional regulator [Bradyrhizobium sp.]|nr:TetR/AcrR family transcriptional regulator [Bradyrhizobium sp.]